MCFLFNIPPTCFDIIQPLPITHSFYIYIPLADLDFTLHLHREWRNRFTWKMNEFMVFLRNSSSNNAILCEYFGKRSKNHRKKVKNKSPDRVKSHSGGCRHASSFITAIFFIFQKMCVTLVGYYRNSLLDCAYAFPFW